MTMINPSRYQPYEIYSREDYQTPIKLSVGEYDEALPDPVRDHLLQYFEHHLEDGCLSYPSDHSAVSLRLKSAIQAYNRLDSPDSLLLTGGSTEALRLIFSALLGNHSPVLFPVPSYSNALNLLKTSTSCIHSVTCLDIDHLFHAMDERHYEMVYLVQPNNPVGYAFSETDIATLASLHPDTTFVVDACYLEYDHNPDHYAFDRRNIITPRTFSKAFGLAGLRIGYLYSHPDTIARLNIFRDPHQPGELAKSTAWVALQNLHHYEVIWQRLRDNRRWLIRELGQLGIHADAHSKGMFIMAAVSLGTNTALCQFLKQHHNILVKPLKGEVFGLEEDRYIRIGLARRAKLEMLLTGIRDYLARHTSPPH